MAINTLPPFYTMRYTEPDGNLSAQAQIHEDQTYQVLNDVVTILNTVVTASQIDNTTMPPSVVPLTNFGLVFPSFTTAQITLLAPDALVGTVWFDTTQKKAVIKTDDPAVIETITST